MKLIFQAAKLTLKQ